MKNLVLLISLFLLISCSGPDKKEIPQEESVDLNAYALKNGKYKVKIQIFPVFRRGDTKVSPEDIKSCKFSLVSFLRNKKNQDRL